MTLRGRITRLVANSCIARLVVLASEDTRSPIVIHITSSEGSVSEVLGILSTMNGIHCPVVTFCRAEVIGPAAVLAAHGLRGYRVATPGCRFSFKMGPTKGSQGDSMRGKSLFPLLADVLAKDTRRKPEEILDWFHAGAVFGSPEALRLGFIDAIASEPLFPKIGAI